MLPERSVCEGEGRGRGLGRGREREREGNWLCACFFVRFFSALAKSNLSSNSRHKGHGLEEREKGIERERDMKKGRERKEAAAR